MDFDKLSLSAPSRMSISGNITGNANIDSTVSGNLFGKSFCSEINGVTWDSNNLQCIIKGNVVSAFTLMSPVAPYEPSEINYYTKI